MSIPYVGAKLYARKVMAGDILAINPG